MASASPQAWAAASARLCNAQARCLGASTGEESLSESLALLDALGRFDREGACSRRAGNAGPSFWCVLWAELGWLELLRREESLRAVALHHVNEGGITSTQEDLLRPPFFPGLHTQLAKKEQELQERLRLREAPPLDDVDAKLVELLCSHRCRPGFCERGLCWHCRHVCQYGQRPEELRSLLAYARNIATVEAGAMRAKEIARGWPAPVELAAAVVQVITDRVRPDDISVDRYGVLVLGGVGVTAIRAASAGASDIWIWEQNPAIAVAVRTVASVAGYASQVHVLEGSEATALDAGMPDLEASLRLVVLEGFEADGLIGSGVLEQLRTVQRRWPHLFVQNHGRQVRCRVLPAQVVVSVRLADTLLGKVCGFDVSALDFYLHRLPPPLVALPEHATALIPRPCTEERVAFVLELASMPEVQVNREAPCFTHCGLKLSRLCDGPGVASAVMVRWSVNMWGSAPPMLAGGQLLPGLPFWGISVSHLPALALPEEGGLPLRCFCSPAKMWFDVDLSNLPQGCLPLHGAPFGHAYLPEWYGQMLRDHCRNDAYEESIRDRLQEHMGAPCDVVDIGSGCGLLSFFALRHGANRAIGLEHVPGLADVSEDIFAINLEEGALPESSSFEVLCRDACSVTLPDETRCDILVSELLDASGLGEKTVQMIRHGKFDLLKRGVSQAQVIPRRLRICAVLLQVGLPNVAGVDMTAFEAFWAPTSTSVFDSNFAPLDLNSAESGHWAARSNVVNVFDIDLSAGQKDIIESLMERSITFELLVPSCEETVDPLLINAIAWWFEADLASAGRPSIWLTNRPCRFDVCAPPTRLSGTGPYENQSYSTEALPTHWGQAVAALGPWRLGSRSDAVETVEARAGDTLAFDVQTDGATLRWRLAAAHAHLRDSRSSHSRAETVAISERIKVATATLNSSREIWEEVCARAAMDGDVARVAAFQAAALDVAVQGELFGCRGCVTVAASRLLRETYS